MIERILRRASVEVGNRGRKLASAVRPYRSMKETKEALDEQYATGGWDYLGWIEEAPRFGVVSAYCRILATEGSLLEIGAGEGLLAKQLDRASIAYYTGVDVSSVAVSRAQSFADQNTQFVTADAQTYEPGQFFDLIVFNEVLEYFDDPLGVVRRYEPFLTPGGHLVVSLFDEPFTVRTRRIWKRLHSAYELVAHARVSTVRGYRWDIEVLRVQSEEAE